jgi:hypothetical protein
MEKTNIGENGDDDKKPDKDKKENGERDNEKLKERNKKETKTPKANIKPSHIPNSTTPASQKRSEGVKSEKAVENQKTFEPVHKESEESKRSATPALPMSLSRNPSKSSISSSKRSASGSQSQGGSSFAPRSPTGSPSRKSDSVQEMDKGPTLDYTVPAPSQELLWAR